MKCLLKKPKKIAISLLVLFLLCIMPSTITNAKTQSKELNEDKAKILYKEKIEAIAVFNSNNEKINIYENDIDLMAQIVYAESRGEPYEGKIAVASVILNRLKNNKFPMNVKDVILQKGAFSCINNGNISVTPDNESYHAVYDALNGIDPTCSALYFYNPRIASCSWMHHIKKDNTIEIGNHIFFVTN